MSFHEKRAIVNVVTPVLVTAGYSLYLYARYLATGGNLVNDPVFWARAFLVLIPISIVASTLVSIAFTLGFRLIMREHEPSVTDERDQIIALKGHRNALFVFSIGVVLAMSVMALGTTISTLFIMIIYAGLLASIVDELTQFALYRRGS